MTGKNWKIPLESSKFVKFITTSKIRGTLNLLFSTRKFQ